MVAQELSELYPSFLSKFSQITLALLGWVPDCREMSQGMSVARINRNDLNPRGGLVGVLEAFPLPGAFDIRWCDLLRPCFRSGICFGSDSRSLGSPRIGERNAELLEAPLMLLVIITAARWVVRRFQLPLGASNRILVGMIALTFGLLFEFTLVLELRGLSLTEYFRTRDPISGSVYYLTLVLFALMPLLVRQNGSVTRSA